MGAGDSPFGGIAKMLSDKGGAPGGDKPPDAGGSLKAQGEAVKKVLEKMAQSSQAGKTYFSRAIQMIEQGLQIEAEKGPGTPAKPQPDSPGVGQGGGMEPPAAFPG